VSFVVELLIDCNIGTAVSDADRIEAATPLWAGASEESVATWLQALGRANTTDLVFLDALVRERRKVAVLRAYLERSNFHVEDTVALLEATEDKT